MAGLQPIACSISPKRVIRESIPRNMSPIDGLPKYFVLAVLAAGIGVMIWQLAGPNRSSIKPVVDVKIPTLSALASDGKIAFDANCIVCHGQNAAGTEKGPPLVHDIYNPGHHADGAFFLAAKLGVRQHHWSYGDMPPQRQVTEPQIAAIVQYIRELQVANGIGHRPHRM
jgi:mono/diheme cytochrome c family protein